jgi:hypothetical protein
MHRKIAYSLCIGRKDAMQHCRLNEARREMNEFGAL